MTFYSDLGFINNSLHKHVTAYDFPPNYETIRGNDALNQKNTLHCADTWMTDNTRFEFEIAHCKI